MMESVTQCKAQMGHRRERRLLTSFSLLILDS